MTEQQNIDPDENAEGAAPAEPDTIAEDELDAEGAAEFPAPQTLESADVEPVVAEEPEPADDSAPVEASDGEQESSTPEPVSTVAADDEEEDSSIYPLPSEEESWGGLLRLGAIVAGIVTLLYLIFRKRD